jgi:hypothetical protein
MQEKLWKRIYAAKKECGRLNDTAIQKQSEVSKLEQRLVKEIEFEAAQAGSCKLTSL